MNFQPIEELTISELIPLEPKDLKILQDECEAYYEQAKAYKDRLNNAIAMKYQVHLSELRKSLSKQTGIVRCQDREFIISSEIPKKPKWDQKKLEQIANKIRDAGDNPSEFLKITYSVSESKYNAWPEVLREQFESARTLDLGKERFEIKEGSL